MRVALCLLMEASLRQRTMAIFVKRVTQLCSLHKFCGHSQCKRFQFLSFLLFVFRLVCSDNFDCFFVLRGTFQ